MAPSIPQGDARGFMSWRARFPGVTELEWRDWRWQHRNALRTGQALARVVELDRSRAARPRAGPARFRFAVTPYYASLMDTRHPFCPVRMQAIPRAGEAGLALPGRAPRPPRRGWPPPGPRRRPPLPRSRAPPGHRPCSRVLPALHAAPHHGRGRRAPSTAQRWSEGIAYVRAHPEVRDVLVSGGDPLVLSDRARGVDPGGSCAPCRTSRSSASDPRPGHLPDAHRRRPSATRCGAMKPLFVVTHFNHPKESRSKRERPASGWWTWRAGREPERAVTQGKFRRRGRLTNLNHRLLSWPACAPTTFTRPIRRRAPVTCARRIASGVGDPRGSCAGTPAVWRSRTSRGPAGGRREGDHPAGVPPGRTALRSAARRRAAEPCRRGGRLVPQLPRRALLLSRSARERLHAARTTRSSIRPRNRVDVPRQISMIAKVIAALAVFTTGAHLGEGYAGRSSSSWESSCACHPAPIRDHHAVRRVPRVHGPVRRCTARRLAGAIGCIVGSASGLLPRL